MVSAIQVSGRILAPAKSSWNGAKDCWIEFSEVNGLVITGSGLGVIDGQGSDWWGQGAGCDRPTALKMNGCNGLHIEGLTHFNSQKNHITLTDCGNVTISGITIEAPEDSPNADGIDISHSTNVRIEHFNIGTGDDCVAINGGCSDITITNVVCGPGHGISVGSLAASEATEKVESVRVQNCNFTDTLNGVRIKTWQPSAVKISDVTFNGIRGSLTNTVVINLNCCKTVACTNITMNQISIETIKSKASASSYCMNALGKENDTSPNVPCLQ
ncbi:probable polygalacturonase At3g15720 [Papaver somniferum]|uniref:probable polygalacturonase At3g15720 n=1 Tax=Papaver somniferum TaxID=3469 RepID=UPI000E6FCC2D|nr:probable polygalacturonase At3g15720 [Papaver somniferum]